MNTSSRCERLTYFIRFCAAGMAILWLGSVQAQAQARSGSTAEAEAALRQRIFDYQAEFSDLVRQSRGMLPRERERVLGSWQESHAAALAALEGQLEQLRQKRQTERPAAGFAPRPSPAGLTSKQQAAWELRDEIRQARSEAWRSVRDAPPAERKQWMERFEQENAEALRYLDALEREVAAEVAARASQRSRPPLPSSLPPEEQAALSERRRLSAERSVLIRQHRDSTPAVRKHALEQWEQENATRLDAFTTQLP